MLIYLVGYMGSGKTTVGKKLSALLNYGFVDLDELIEREYRITIPRIFEKYDEKTFRVIEQKSLQHTFSYTDTLVSTGGGAPCFFDNMEQINRHGISIYLQLSTKSIYHRLIGSKKKRPLLKEKSPEEIMQFIEKTLTFREPFYLKANLTVKGEDLKPSELYEILKPELNT
ncbi:MAG: AAA family ATPase [Bacteroidales bacterium]|nr:AAA family ATPase [Bacteroidales bacterium]